MSENPYQAPAVEEVSAPSSSLEGAQEVRQRHLRHEASLKGMGVLFLLGGLFSLIALGIFISNLVTGAEVAPLAAPDLLSLLILAGSIGLQLWAWWCLRSLKPMAKIPAAIASAMGFLQLSLVTLIAVYFLYLLFSAKGRTILSPAYKEIMAQTPDMKYKTPLWNWIVLGVILVLVIGGFAALILTES